MENNIYTPTKICSTCKETKLITEYALRKASVDGLQTTCRSCQKEYRDRNKDQYKAHSKKRYAENRDDILVMAREWKTQNKDHVREINKQYRHNHRDAFIQYDQASYYRHRQAYLKELRKSDPAQAYRHATKWAKNNPGKLRAQAAKRVARLTQATPKWVNYKAIESIYVECANTTKSTGIPHHVDHIVPLRGKTVCGLHVEYNLRIITATENMEKGNTLNEELALFRRQPNFTGVSIITK